MNITQDLRPSARANRLAGARMRRAFAAGSVFLSLVATLSTAAAQQAYPNRPIHFISPYPPGGALTILAHLVGQKLTESWGQPLIVENRPGGDTIIGSEAVAKSPADGYTVLFILSTHVTIPFLHRSVPFDVIKDFTPVATLARGEMLLVLHPSVPATNLQEFIALARSKPGRLNYSSGGEGSTNHLAGELLCNLAGIKMQHIPYKGGGPALTDLISGQVQAFINTQLTLIPHIKSGKIKAIAIAGENRSPALPHVPPFTEAGLAGFDVGMWFGILAPASTPTPITDKLSSEIGNILFMPDIKDKLISQGLEPFRSTPDQFTALMKADMARYARVIKTANIKIEGPSFSVNRTLEFQR